MALSCYKISSEEDVIAKLCVLSSSSAGNATFLASGRTRILIDAGLSRKEITRRLGLIGEDPANLDAILVTHEHTDHISGLPLIARAHKVPVYLSHLTAPAIPWGDASPRLELFSAGTGFSIGDIQVASFTIPHDAADPVGFCFQVRDMKIGLVTDLGYLPDSVRFHIRDCHLLVLESNHDLEMLKVGPYPWHVKQRVMSRMGHLSNESVSDFIHEELSGSTQTLVLSHLSEHNNHPEIVRLVAGQALERRGLPTRLVIAEPRQLSEVVHF